MARDVEDRKTIVYVAVNETNQKRYIGITCRSLKRRIADHFARAKAGAKTHFAKALRKHGRDAFVFSVLRECDSYSEAKAWEVLLIKEIGAEYNETAGGDGCLGYTHSDETRKRISNRQKGRDGPWKGKTLPESFRDGHKRYLMNNPDKARILAMGPKSRQKEVVCLNDGLVYASVVSAARFYDVSASSVCEVCKRSEVRKTVGGLVFRYLGDHHGGPEEAGKVAAEAKSSQLAGLMSNHRREHASASQKC